MPIKEELMKVLPFKGIQSRHVIAVMLSYYDHAEKVYVVMRKMSHQSRAYIVNAGGLKGFLIREPVMWALLSAEEEDSINLISAWQCVNMETLRKLLYSKIETEERLRILE